MVKFALCIQADEYGRLQEGEIYQVLGGLSARVDYVDVVMPETQVVTVEWYASRFIFFSLIEGCLEKHPTVHIPLSVLPKGLLYTIRPVVRESVIRVLQDMFKAGAVKPGGIVTKDLIRAHYGYPSPHSHLEKAAAEYATRRGAQIVVDDPVVGDHDMVAPAAIGQIYSRPTEGPSVGVCFEVESPDYTFRAGSAVVVDHVELCSGLSRSNPMVVATITDSLSKEVVYVVGIHRSIILKARASGKRAVSFLSALQKLNGTWGDCRLADVSAGVFITEHESVVRQAASIVRAIRSARHSGPAVDVEVEFVKV